MKSQWKMHENLVVEITIQAVNALNLKAMILAQLLQSRLNR